VTRTAKGPAVVIEVPAEDYITCTGQCRAIVGIGRVCRCPARTKGPCIEAVLPKVVDGDVKVTGPKVGRTRVPKPR